MASSSALILFSLLIFSFSALAISKCPSASDEKVSLSLYYETFCPGCSEFIVHELPKIFKNRLIDIVDLNLVPYGNANLLKNGTIICQHGPFECFLNTVEACAINSMPEYEYFEFIRCTENFIAEGKAEESSSCLDKTPGHGKILHDCYTSGRGQKIELQYAKVTAALNPPHEYVPWVTVNEVPIRMDIENFMKYICKAYKGTSTPKACKELPKGIIPAEPKLNMKVCRVNDASRMTKPRPRGITGWKF
ncbi:hypothetical protein MKW98_032702 [Papaver atlanticum]|uniref:Gamma-interferon-inducible lysosomal thiol reductase n=1 Tax=Papaver atlanticum TaxID=357466 RepID=A0AAD4SX46_9MAGN|nr:hypothetical protein MKW98_032702 [Papaver atlanticum]